MEKEEESSPGAYRVSTSTPTPHPAPSSAVTAHIDSRSRRNNNNRNQEQPKKTTPRKGTIDNLGASIYVCVHEDPKREVDIRKVTDGIVLYVNTNVRNSEDMICIFEYKKPPELITDKLLDMEGLTDG